MAVETQLYDVLGVSPRCSVEEISKAYKKLALKYHPDKTNHDKVLTEKFKELTKAYEVLKNNKMRRLYDQYGKIALDGSFQEPPAKQARNGNGQTAFTSADIFSKVFNDINSMFTRDNIFPNFSSEYSMSNVVDDEFTDIFDSQNGMGSNIPRKGSDIHHTFKVHLSDLYFGKQIKLKLPRNRKCQLCLGHGGVDLKLCRTCRGQGKVIITLFNQFSQYQEFSLCKSCGGTGTYIAPRNRCQGCNFGYVNENKIIKVNIHPGSYGGDKIILKGEADEGRNIIPGDVIIHLQEVSHVSLVRKFNDLYMEHDIDLRTALLGGEIVLRDFYKKGQDLKINVNVHGYKNVNDKINSNINKACVVGTINTGEPKIVRGFGMPINNYNGTYYQTIDSADAEASTIFDLSRYKKGNLFIKFNVQLPLLADFAGEKAFESLLDILPSTSSNSSRNLDVLESNLSNIPTYSEESNNSTDHGNLSDSITSIDENARDFLEENYNPGSDSEADVSNMKYNYDDIDIEDTQDIKDNIEKNEESFYNDQWSKDEMGPRGIKRRKESASNLNFSNVY